MNDLGFVLIALTTLLSDTFAFILDSPSICSTEECKLAAARIISNLNRDADPCEDFFDYACGRFRHEYPKGRNYIDALGLLEITMKERLRNLLEDDILKTHGSNKVRIAKKIYDDCMKKPATLPPDVDKKKWCQAEAQSDTTDVFDRVYVDKFFSSEAYEDAKKLVSQIRTTFVQDIKIDWIDDKTKEIVSRNLSNIPLLVGYPEWIMNNTELDRKDHPDRPRWPLSVTAVTAVLDVDKIVVPAGVLQGPVFSIKVPDAVNYGSGGFMVAHELSHALHVWTNYSRAGKDFETKGDCIVKQVENIEEKQTGAKYENGTQRTILPEMLADIGGVNASFTAFKTVSPNRYDQRLPGLTHLESEQLFFISLANTLCIQAEDKFVREYMAFVGWPYNRFRVNVPLMNSPDFAHAFKCRPGSKMNPRNKCNLW